MVRSRSGGGAPPRVPNRASKATSCPELDLLDATFEHTAWPSWRPPAAAPTLLVLPARPQGRLGGGQPIGLTWMLDEMRQVFDRHPEVSRTLYLVDEEAIGAATRRGGSRVGAGAHAARRRVSVGVVLPRRPGRGSATGPGLAHRAGRHVAPARRDGLRRMLFGVESGVTSILARFNKETTAEQNALAIRTLSALGIPTRFTYITFDQLMDTGELRASHAFQGRTDLCYTRCHHLSVAEIVDGVRDEDFVAAHSHRPAVLHRHLLHARVDGVPHRCRLHPPGAGRGPGRRARPSMGRVDAAFADWRIGACSVHAQLWVDRNFAIDYTLKSLEKILDGTSRRLVRGARVVIKQAAFALLTRMLALIAETPTTHPDPAGFGSRRCAPRWTSNWQLARRRDGRAPSTPAAGPARRCRRRAAPRTPPMDTGTRLVPDQRCGPLRHLTATPRRHPAPDDTTRRRRDSERMPVTGTFIALEGPDGVGKTTLAARLGDLDYEAVRWPTRPMSGGPAATGVRRPPTSLWNLAIRGQPDAAVGDRSVAQRRRDRSARRVLGRRAGRVVHRACRHRRGAPPATPATT